MITLSKTEREIIENSIRDINDFPKPGIVFKDITTLLNNKEAFATTMNHLYQRYKEYNLDYIAGIDARGFIFGSALAQMLNLGFVPIRKKGKLPSDTICEKYELEYGFDELEIHKDAFLNKNAKVLIIDDLCATGGTATASAKLVQKLGATLVEVCFIMNLTSLAGSKKVEKYSTVYSVLDI